MNSSKTDLSNLSFTCLLLVLLGVVVIAAIGGLTIGVLTLIVVLAALVAGYALAAKEYMP